MSKCLECNVSISSNVDRYSVENFSVPLCMECQDKIRQLPDTTTDEAINFYFELKKRNVSAKLEKFDGFKTIDIAIPEAKVNIEVDGAHHNYDKKQALADLKRTFFSFKKGYLTLRIPNSLSRDRKTLEETANYVVEFLNESKKRNQTTKEKISKDKEVPLFKRKNIM